MHMHLESTWPRQVLAFVRLGRPHFLAGGFVMDALGVAAALFSGYPLNVPALLWGQVAITATQWMVHYANDYFDLEIDRANQTATHWSGGSRMLPGGYIAPRVALAAALLLACLAATAGLVLVFAVRTGPLTLPLLGLAMTLSWAYSAPPLKLHSRGVGEVVTALVVPGLTPLLGFYLQTGRVAPVLLLAIVPLILIQVNVQLSVEYPDVVADAASGKRTLVVRWGQRAARLHVAALLAAYLLLPLLALAGLPAQVAAAAAVTAPLAAWQAVRISRGAWARPESWNSVALTGIVILLGTAALEAGAFAWLALSRG